MTYMIDATLNYGNGEERDLDVKRPQNMEELLSSIRFIVSEPGLSSVVFTVVIEGGDNEL